jgi:catabolite regulation protein CreA
MKIGKAALALLLLATPAMADSSKTVGKVTFTCEITGSDKDGITVTSKNDGDDDKDCTATCKVKSAGGDSQVFKYSAKSRGHKVEYFNGEAGLKGAPLSEPNITDASCD